MSNIDWDFIKTLEGNNLKGTVPDAKGSKSGVTIASGFDLGARNLNDLAGLPQDIIDLLKPYLGFKGAEAQEMAGNLKVSDEQANIINEFSKAEATENLSRKWKEKTGQEFSELPKNKATVIASAAFQYGDLASETPNFWKQVTEDDWGAAVKNLRNFQDKYPSRRNKEADYFEATEPEESLEAKKKFEAELQRDKQLGIQQAMISGEEGDLGTVEPTDKQVVERAQKAIQDSEIATGKRIIAEPVESQPRPFIDEDGVPALDEMPEVDPLLDQFVDSKDVSVPTVTGQTSYSVPEEATPTQQMQSADTQQMQVEKSTSAIQQELLSPIASTKADKMLPSYNNIKQDKMFLDGYQSELRFGDRVPSINDQNTFDYSMFNPTMGQAFTASGRQFNIAHSIGRMINSSLDPNQKPEEGYSSFNDQRLKREVGEDGLLFFRHSRSHGESMEKVRRMKEDAKDMQTIESSEHGTAFSAAWAFATPTLMSPIAPVQIMRAGKIRRFIGGTAFTYAMTAPQQAFIEAQNEARDAGNTAVALAVGGILGGTLAVAFGKKMTASQIAQMKVDQENFRVNFLGQEPKSAGAMVSPEIARTRAYEQLEQEGLEATGIGIEKLGWNPVLRMMSSPNPIVRNLGIGMTDVGGMMQKKVRSAEEAMEQSVETTFRTKYYSELLSAVRESDLAYLKYRGIESSKSDAGRAFQMIKLSAGDIFNRADGTLTDVQFRARVGMAMRRGDVDNMGDAASQAVTSAAKGYRKLYNRIKNEAQSVRLFEKEARIEIEKLKATGASARQISKAENRLNDIRASGVSVNTAESYLNRVYRIDKIEENVPRFLSKVSNWYIANKGMNATQANKIARQVLDEVTRRKPYYNLDESNNLEFLSNPAGAKSRTVEVPDDVLEEFLENDIETLVRHHVKTMGMDIELTRKYGSVTMDDTLKQVTDEYQRLIDETADASKRSSLAQSMERDLTDIRGLRDRLRGTYGASKDPHALSSRSIRVMKSFNVLVGMGSAMVSSVPDVARIVMTEGLVNAYGKGFARMFDEQAATIAKMSKGELDRAAIAVDATLGLRAHAMSDIGDLFGNRFALERSLNDATGMFFFMNGLNIWNQALKEMSGNVTMLRMTNDIMKKGGWASLSQRQKEKLLTNGIDQQSYGIMRSEILKHGEKQGSQWLPNTDDWTFRNDVLKFRNALNQQVERTIITPGAGDRALWTSTEFGSLMTQFKSYGQGAMIRMLTSGLQEKDAAFWQGAFLIVGLAGLINEIKRQQYGMTRDESFDQKIVNAVDRSGILGWFMDVNNSIEKLSDYKMGMRPMLTDQPSYPVHPTAKMSSIFGPAASTTLNATSIMGDVVNGNVNNKTAEDLRFIFPTGSLFYLDPIYDGVFGGNVNRQTEDFRG